MHQNGKWIAKLLEIIKVLLVYIKGKKHEQLTWENSMLEWHHRGRRKFSMSSWTLEPCKGETSKTKFWRWSQISARHLERIWEDVKWRKCGGKWLEGESTSLFKVSWLACESTSLTMSNFNEYKHKLKIFQRWPHSHVIYMPRFQVHEHFRGENYIVVTTKGKNLSRCKKWFNIEPCKKECD